MTQRVTQVTEPMVRASPDGLTMTQPVTQRVTHPHWLRHPLRHPPAPHLTSGNDTSVTQ